MTLALDSTVKIRDDVLVQEIAGEMVLLDLRAQEYFGLDPVGTSIFKALQASGDLRAAFDGVLAEYDVESDVLERDVLAFVGTLVESGLAEVAASGTTP